jgi:hypothetical protein
MLILFTAGTLPAKPLQTSDLIGTWRLLYRGHYGYTFRFYRNYRALCMLHLRVNALIFKGVYTIEENNKIRINIYEMKNEQNPARPNLKKNFVKTSSSYFIFQGTLHRSNNRMKLLMQPVTIVIDGMSSAGYFEPSFELVKQ